MSAAGHPADARGVGDAPGVPLAGGPAGRTPPGVRPVRVRRGSPSPGSAPGRAADQASAARVPRRLEALGCLAPPRRAGDPDEARVRAQREALQDR